MSRVPYFNRSAFDSATTKLESDGWVVYNPVEADIALYGEDLFNKNPTGSIEQAKVRFGFNYRRALHDCLSWICAEADAIYLLDGWQLSGGARTENACAQAIGLITFSERYYPIPWKSNTYAEVSE